jgi:DNA repair photolyase
MKQDKKYKVTQELLKILKFYRYPYVIFTRSDLVADDDYVKILDRRLASIQMSVCSINESLTKKIEPGAPSPAQRLSALSRLAKEGFWTTVRINPLFPIYPDGYYSDPNFDHSKKLRPFPFFSWDMVKTISEHGIPSLLVGMVRLYQHNIRFMNSALGYDFREHFHSSSKLERAALHFSEDETRFYYERIKSLCSQYGVRFSTCYIGNDASGDSFEMYKPMWTNQNDCCDALGNVSAFKKTCADISRIQALPNPVQIVEESRYWNTVQ